MKVKRDEFLGILEKLVPGLDIKSRVEQSDCLVFHDKRIHTYNGELYCHVPSPFGRKVQGAVAGEPVLNILRKLTEEELEITLTESELIIQGKRRKAGITLQKEITLPFGSVETPSEWTKIHEDFTRAIDLVSKCTGSDESRFALTCVHIHPKWVEATDDYQLCRWTMKTGVKSPFLTRQSGIKHVSTMAVKEFSETENWIHFRTADDVYLSCGRFLEEYPDLTNHLEVEGIALKLPKALDETVARAEIMVESSVQGSKRVEVKMDNDRIVVKGRGPTGWFSESKKVSYSGKPTKFFVPPQVLTHISTKHQECVVGETKMRAVTGKCIYVTCLEREEEGT